jgi:hypothetical protein
MNPKIHYHVRKSPTLDPILSHMNPFYVLTLYSYNIHFIIIFPLRLSLESDLLPSGFAIEIFVYTYHVL